MFSQNFKDSFRTNPRNRSRKMFPVIMKNLKLGLTKFVVFRSLFGRKNLFETYTKTGQKLRFLVSHKWFGNKLGESWKLHFCFFQGHSQKNGGSSFDYFDRYSKAKNVVSVEARISGLIPVFLNIWSHFRV